MRKLYIFLWTIIFCSSALILRGQKIIEGRVFDAETNKPLKGVLVFAKNTIKSALTDMTGIYRIIIPEKANTLIFTFQGYVRQEVNIKDISRVDVGMRNFSSRETDNIVVIGSRDRTRTKSDSYVGVDIIPVKDLVNETGYVELTQILHYFAPSFNANRQTGSDLADHIDPVSLRGLGPDQVLFLINGKRYLRSAIINVFGNRGRGNVNTDLNAIPASAIERIEVLRDGAAAQYGSDAVAGVVNVVMKSDKPGTTGALSYGSHMTGWGNTLNYGQNGKIIPVAVDGGRMNVNVTHSLQLGKGNFNITGDYLTKDFTHRPNNDSIFPDLNYRQNFGDANKVASSLFFNGSFPVAGGEIYTFGGYQKRHTISNNWTISPDDSVRNVYQIFPNGYNPQLLTDIDNVNFVVGNRSKFGGWNADFSANYAINNIKIKTQNTLNPSLLLNSRTSFNNGGYQFDQYSINSDFSKKFNQVLYGLNLAFGGEYRLSEYKIFAGDEAAWKNYMPYPLILPRTDGSKDTIRKIGTSQGFPGVSKDDALNRYRTNIGVYGDAELDISRKLLIAAALRYEQYSDFGRAIGGKIAFRYRPSSKVSVRFSTQTGFRAPSLAQIHFRSTINDVDELGNAFEKVVANNNSVLAKKLGIPDLTVEKSVNFSLGFNYKPSQQWSFSADAYRIAVYNRIILTGGFGHDDERIGTELKKMNLRYAQFYINALNSSTLGGDLSASFKSNVNGGRLTQSLVGNINYMTTPTLKINHNFKGKDSLLINPRELQFIVAAAPFAKCHYTLNYNRRNSNFNLHITCFSKIEFVAYSEVPIPNNVYKPRLITDVTYSRRFGKHITCMVGVNNLFDVYPTIQSPDTTETGGQWDAVQNDTGGAFFFSRLSFQF